MAPWIGAHLQDDRREDHAGSTAKQLFQQRLKPRLFLRLVLVAAERFAALNRIGDVLAMSRISANAGRRFGGDMRVDEPGRSAGRG